MQYKLEVTSEALKELNDHFRGPELSSLLREIMVQFRSLSKYHNVDPCTWDAAYSKLLNVFKEYNFDPFED